MPSVETAAVAAIAYAALFAGHQLGDHPFQSCTAAVNKSAPSIAEIAAGAPPFRGWRYCVQHVLVYLSAQAVCLALIALVTPLTLDGAVAALAVSGATHAVIDRRWIVRGFLMLKRADDWPEGPYLVDQSLHLAALLVAAVLAAAATTGADLAGALVGSALIVLAGLAVERQRARLAVPAVPVGSAKQ